MRPVMVQGLVPAGQLWPLERVIAPVPVIGAPPVSETASVMVAVVAVVVAVREPVGAVTGIACAAAMAVAEVPE